jgi:hypothetical protein
MLAIDHRPREHASAFELIGQGVSWLGPRWDGPSSTAATTVARPTCWKSDSVADLAEWSFKASGHAFTRTALLLRGRRLALLGEEVHALASGSAPLESHFGLFPGVRAEPIADARGWTLRSGATRGNAQVLPPGLPCLPYETDRGSFTFDERGGFFRLRAAPRGRRCWMPLLISWDAQRHRRRLSWRVLTVSEEGKACAPDVAFAVRVSWGRSETFVIYRSLVAPATRAFLGHQTRARFLVGLFGVEGLVEPLVSLE